MKVCEKCGDEINTRDGDNRCSSCDRDCFGDRDGKRTQRLRRAKANRKDRASVMQDLGLVKVRGALGGTYWEWF